VWWDVDVDGVCISKQVPGKSDSSREEKKIQLTSYIRERERERCKEKLLLLELSIYSTTCLLKLYLLLQDYYTRAWML